jgi:hypothetical protein
MPITLGDEPLHVISAKSEATNDGVLITLTVKDGHRSVPIRVLLEPSVARELNGLQVHGDTVERWRRPM